MKNLRTSAAALFAVIALSGCTEKKVQKATPPGVTVAPAVKGYVIDSSEIIGQAKAYDSVNLVARVKGFLTKRNFKEGYLVKKNQLLFEIEKDEYQAKVKSYEAQLTRAKAQLMNAEVEYNRQKKLLNENATAKRTYDDALANKMVAEANVLEAQAGLQNAKLNLSYTEIYSPFDGRVGFATYSVGNVVGPDSKNLANVVRLNPIRIEFNVNEVDILKLNIQRIHKKRTPANMVIVKLRFQDGTLYQHQGRVEFSSNKVNAGTGTLLVQAVFPNKENIIVPGMFVRVLIINPKKIKAILIPQPAVQEDQAGKYVLLVTKDNKVKRRRVTVGLKSGPSIQIKEGIEVGERVIIDGIQKVRSGTEVKPEVDQNYAVQQHNIEIASEPEKKTSDKAETPPKKKTPEKTKPTSSTKKAPEKTKSTPPENKTTKPKK